MGVLKRITDEYFGDIVRSEDGKKITVHGCDVIVPPNWDEEDFLKSVKVVLTEAGVAEFVSEYWYRKLDTSLSTNIECGNSYHLCVTKYDEIVDEEYLTTEDIPNKITYDSIIKFLTYIVKDVDIDTKDNKDYICLTGEGDIDDVLYIDDLDEYEIENAYDELIDYFLKTFGEKANIIYDDLYTITYMGTTLNVIIEFETLLYAREMIEWWHETLSEIKEQGPKRYFGYDVEEE